MVNVRTIASRRQVDALIKADPIMVSFERRQKIDAGTGGWTWGPPQALAPQQVSLIPFKRRMSEYLVNTELGEVPDLPYELLGRYNLDIQEEDTFTYNGNKYQVKTITAENRDIQITAQVDYYGATNG